jgi:hypothetical protein
MINSTINEIFNKIENCYNNISVSYYYNYNTKKIVSYEK